MSPVVWSFGAFVLMEPAAYLTHRFLMHRPPRVRGAGAPDVALVGGAGAPDSLRAWHRSHHRPRRSVFEGNDLYPLVASAVTVVMMALGASVGGLRPLAWVGAGVTAYGAAYLFVHDLYIHRRVRSFRWRCAPLERVREAHRIHHLWGGEPYGFLFPIVPAELRARAATVARDPLREPQVSRQAT